MKNKLTKKINNLKDVLDYYTKTNNKKHLDILTPEYNKLKKQYDKLYNDDTNDESFPDFPSDK